jgi:putative phosphonate transport system ATP-binding protein
MHRGNQEVGVMASRYADVTVIVSHDLGVIRTLANRVMVLRYGRVVEQGLTDQVLEDPQQAYTQQLVHAKL